MLPKSRKTLEEIADAARFIVEAVAGLSLNDYAENRLVRNAVERNFEIIGEALRRLTHHDPELASSFDYVSEAIAFRNLLIHGYDIVADDLVWQVVEDNLPDLLRQVATRLEEK